MLAARFIRILNWWNAIERANGGPSRSSRKLSYAEQIEGRHIVRHARRTCVMYTDTVVEVATVEGGRKTR